MINHIQLGPLIETTIQKDFPECWIILANMMNIEYDWHEQSGTLTLLIGNENIELTKKGGMSTSAVIPKDILTTLIISVIKQNRKKK